MRPPAAKDDPYTTSDEQYEDPERPQHLFEIPVTVPSGTSLSDLHFYFDTQSTQCYLVSKEDTRTWETKTGVTNTALDSVDALVEKGKRILDRDIGLEPVVKGVENLKSKLGTKESELQTTKEQLLAKESELQTKKKEIRVMESQIERAIAQTRADATAETTRKLTARKSSRHRNAKRFTEYLRSS